MGQKLWVLLWLSPHQKREFGRRTAAAARPRDRYVDLHRPLRRSCRRNLPPSRRRQRRHAASIPLPTCFCFETEATPTTARRLSAPPTGGTAALAAPLEERKRGHVVCRVERHGGVVVLGVGLSQRSWVRLTRARRRQWSIFPLCAALSTTTHRAKGRGPAHPQKSHGSGNRNPHKFWPCDDKKEGFLVSKMTSAQSESEMGFGP